MGLQYLHYLTKSLYGYLQKIKQLISKLFQLVLFDFAKWRWLLHEFTADERTNFFLYLPPKEILRAARAGPARECHKRPAQKVRKKLSRRTSWIWPVWTLVRFHHHLQRHIHKTYHISLKMSFLTSECRNFFPGAPPPDPHFFFMILQFLFTLESLENLHWNLFLLLNINFIPRGSAPGPQFFLWKIFRVGKKKNKRSRGGNLILATWVKLCPNYRENILFVEKWPGPPRPR